ncbi:MAG: restriction endonuclease subunit S [Gallionella sp.]
MKIAAYQSHKPSDSTWLPAIPDTWQQIRGRFVMSVNPAAMRLRNLDDSDEVSFVPMEAVGENGGLNLDRTKPLDGIGSGYTEFEDGDVVIAKITPCFENGKSALASGLKNGVAFGTTELHVLRAGMRLDKQFLFYLTTSHTFRVLGESEMYGAGGQKRVPPDFAKDFRVPLPPIEEQQAIVRFLDTQTVRIDTLLAKKRQLIEKLKEKRSALIARTVTRGLPPKAAKAAGLEPHPVIMDSGLAWLGEIPSHWQAIALKHIVSIPITDGPHETPEFVPEGIPFASVEAVWDGKVHLSSVRGYISEDDNLYYRRKYSPQRNDIFIVKSGSTTGKIAIVDFDDEFNVWSPLAAVRCNLRKAWPQFVFHALCSDYFQGLIQVSWSFGTQPNIGMGVLGNLNIALPPLEEQFAIANYLDRETGHIDQLTAKVEAAIERLTEYRQALITAAVTGKIDVREAVV